MTGIFASVYFWRIGWSALPSRAAKQSAPGFLASSCWSREICTSTCDSLSGPMKLIVTPSLVASSWAPCLTATQNWCCQPLEMIGIYQFGCPAVGVAEAPQPAMSTTPTAKQTKRLIAILPPNLLFNRVLPTLGLTAPVASRRASQQTEVGCVTTVV